MRARMHIELLRLAGAWAGKCGVRTECRDRKKHAICMVMGVRGGAQRLHAKRPGRYCSGGRMPAQAGGWQGCAVFYERDFSFYGTCVSFLCSA